MQLLTFQSSYHRNLITNLSYTDLLLALLQVSTRVCVLSDSLVFRTACDDYYLEKQSCRRPQRAAGLAAVHHVLPPPVGGGEPLLTSNFQMYVIFCRFVCHVCHVRPGLQWSPRRIIWVCARYRCSMNLWICRSLWDP